MKPTVDLTLPRGELRALCHAPRQEHRLSLCERPRSHERSDSPLPKQVPPESGFWGDTSRLSTVFVLLFFSPFFFETREICSRISRPFRCVWEQVAWRQLGSLLLPR